MRKFLTIFAIVANLILVDAVTKELAAGFLKGAAALSVIPGFFDLAYVENRGCAWGLFQGQVWPLAVFGLLALAVLIWQRRKIFNSQFSLLNFSEPLLYAGIIGNLIDRLCRGYVIDMFDFHWRAAYHFPCFNVADVCITTAAGLLILSSFIPTTKQGK